MEFLPELLKHEERFSRLTEQRQQRLWAVASRRLKGIELVLDNVDDPHNRSAVFRSADAFGLINVHVINERAAREGKRAVSMRAEQWLRLKGYSSVKDYLTQRQETPARHFLASAHPEARPLHEVFSWDGPVPQQPQCLVFGNEHAGVSAEWKTVPHEKVWIPMVGFSESLNISVAAAVSLFLATQSLRSRLGAQTDLSLEEQIALVREWTARQ